MIDERRALWAISNELHDLTTMMEATMKNKSALRLIINLVWTTSPQLWAEPNLKLRESSMNDQAIEIDKYNW